MEFSHNEQSSRELKLRHIFLPGTYAFVFEVVVGITALIVFNGTELSNQLLTKKFDNVDPLPVFNQVFANLLDGAQQYAIVQKVLLFLMWALVGALLYILIFRILQIIFGVKHSFGLGLRFMRQEHTRGLLHWFASLHDFFMTAIIVVLGGAAMLFGFLVCFGIASQELTNGLADSFPDNVWELLLSLVAAVLSVRLITLGLSLTSSRFRNWYTT